MSAQSLISYFAMTLTRFLLLISLTWLTFTSSDAIARPYESLGYLVGAVDGDEFGSAITSLDFNQDGWEDLVVGAPASDANGISSGRVYIYFGGPGADLIADRSFSGASSSFFGKSLASAGDFNGDGAEDLLVGAPFYDLPASSAGAVYLYFGGPSADTIPDHIFTGVAASDYFGISVAGSTSFNGDGYSDIVIGAYRADWGSFTDAGKAYVYFGGSSPDFTVDRILVGSADGERFGYSLTSADFGGDGYAEIAVGAYSYNGSLLNQGRIYIFSGGASADSIYDLAITGDSSGAKFGWSLTAGKVTADGFPDLVMGTDGYPIDTLSAGKVFVFDGGPSMDATPIFSYNLGRPQHDYLGYSVAAKRLVGSDLYDDLLVGIPGADDGILDGGGATVITGGSTHPVDTTVFGSSISEESGKAVGICSGFGGLDLVVAAVGAPSYSNYRGRVAVYRTSIGSLGPCCVATVGNIDCSAGDGVDVGDLTALIDNLFINFTPLCCGAEANCDGMGGIDVGDLTALIDNLFINFTPLPSCAP